MAQDTEVLLVLVATNGASWLRDTIAGIKAQTHENLQVVAIDNASSDGSRALLEKAFGKTSVATLQRRAGYARALVAALNAAGDKAKTAHAFLLLHDDCAMEPDTVASLLQTLDYESVAVAGPKLVEWEQPDMLQEAGLSIDRYARLFDPLERGELDQGQHDRVKETMWVSSACMLVTRELIERVGFFDTRYVLFREDMDFCWRARLAGAKVAYCGTTKARHAAASLRNAREGWAQGRVRYFVERNLLASLFKNYSRLSLLLILPVAIISSLAGALLYVATGRRSTAAQILEALRWNLAHLPSSIRARTRAQRVRTTPDAEVTSLAMRGAHRVRSLAERMFERVAGDPAEGVEEAEGFATPGQRARRSIRQRIRAHPGATTVFVLVTLYVIGSRTLFASGGMAGADMPAFPDGPGALFRSFFSGWRSGGTGSSAPAPPAVFLSGVLSVVTLGSTWFAQRLLVMAMIPLAGFTAARLASRLGCGVASRRIAGFTYALSPLALWALSQGRLADMALVAVAPAICVPLARATGFAEWNGWRDLVVPGVGLAVATAFSPWAIVFAGGAGAAFAAAAAASGRSDRSVRTLLAGLAVSAAAVVALFPWSLELFREGSPLGLGGRTAPVAAENLIRLVPGDFAPMSFLLAAAFPLAAVAGYLLAPRDREPAARGLVVAGLIGFAVAWAVARGLPWIAPRPALPLALTAVAVAMLVGLGAEGLRPALARRGFGLGQIASAAVALALVVGVGGGGLWLLRGDRPGIQHAGDLTPAFLAADRREYGEFRVLWIGGEPGDVRYALTGPAGDTMETYAERRAGAGEDVLRGLVAGVASGLIDNSGRQFGIFGVRYVFVRGDADPALRDSFERQSDLRFVQRFNRTSVFVNDLWIPVGVGITSQNWTVASNADRAPEAIAGTTGSPEPGDGFVRRRPDVLTGTVREGAKRVLLATAFDSRWHLVLLDADRGVPAERAWGWANGFPAAAAGRAALVWQGQSRYRLMLAGQLAILIAAGAFWSRRVAAERGER